MADEPIEQPTVEELQDRIEELESRLEANNHPAKTDHSAKERINKARAGMLK